MIETITIDTNIIIRLISGDKSCLDIIHNRILVISFITEIELLSWPNLTLQDEKIINSFLNDCFIANISDEIKKATIDLRKNYRLKIPDSIIAATAITKQLTLFSADDVFKRIPHLNFVYVA
jgi:predicted nucleic acid-binding protein